MNQDYTADPKIKEEAITDRSLFREIATLIRPHISRPVDSLLEQTYALGWNRTQLPGKLDFGWNSGTVEALPELGQRFPGRLAIWHGGNMPGTTAAVCLLPESGTGVVVLQNSLGLCDAADWTCQLILDTIFTGKPAHDYLQLAAESATNGGLRMKEVQAQLEKGRVLETEHRPLHAYTGRYYNVIRNWVIEVGISRAGELYLRFQGREDEQYTLRHYHYDTFVWNLPYNETVKRAQYCRSYAYYKMEFEPSALADGAQVSPIACIRWRHDPAVPEGEVFDKSD
jgi:Domain of unknown function (DUF3471)/Beta-lactamase